MIAKPSSLARSECRFILLSHVSLPIFVLTFDVGTNVSGEYNAAPEALLRHAFLLQHINSLKVMLADLRALGSGRITHHPIGTPTSWALL